MAIREKLVKRRESLPGSPDRTVRVLPVTWIMESGPSIHRRSGSFGWVGSNPQNTELALAASPMAEADAQTQSRAHSSTAAPVAGETAGEPVGFPQVSDLLPFPFLFCLGFTAWNCSWEDRFLFDGA